MSSVLQPHEVVLIRHDPDSVTDLSKYVVSIDKFTDVGNNEIPSAQIMFSSDFGRFLTEGDVKFDQFDEFFVKVVSQYSEDDNFERTMILDELMPQTEERGGYVSMVQVYGREWYLTKVKMTGHHYFISFRDMVEEIVRIFNDKRGSEVPLLQIEGLDNIPPYAAGVFDYGYETSCHKALQAVIARLALPVSGGGAGEYYTMRFKDTGKGDTRLILEIFPFGSRDKGDKTVVLKGKDIDTQYISETEQNVKGTMVITRGRAETGRYPKEISEWSGIIEEITNAPPYVADSTYPEGALVHFNNGYHVAITDTDRSPTQNPGGWQGAVNRLLNDFIYSPWTNGNADHYKNLASTNSIGRDGKTMKFPDSNLVVKDGLHYRNWVDFRVRRESDIPSQFKIDNKPVDDTRVLVDSTIGTIGTPFTGNDSFGNAYKDAFVQYRNGKWIVIHNPKIYDECAVLDEGKVRVYGPDIGAVADRDLLLSYKLAVRHVRGEGEVLPSELRWENMDPYYLGHDCFHGATEVTHDTENDHENQKNQNLVNTEILGVKLRGLGNSAVRVSYDFADTPDKDLYPTGIVQQAWYDWVAEGASERARAATAFDFFAADSAYQYGWWATIFQAPFPRKSVTTEGNAGLPGAIFKQPTLDLRNLNYTSGGNKGWGHDDSDDLGQITGLHFLFKFQYTVSDARGNIPLTGNLPFRVTMYDTEDNVWVADFVYRFLGDIQQVIIPIAAFRIYRARNPAALALDDLLQNALSPELKVLEIFETRKIKMITLQWQASYDPAGRYSPTNANRYFINLGATLVGRRPKFIGWFDAVGFIKAPIAQAKSDDYDNRHIMPNIKDYPLVTNQSQLEKIAQAELDLAQFRVDDYVIKTTGRCDLRAGDGVIVEDDSIIPGTDNRKLLSVRKVNYTVNASDGPSGFVRHVTVQARINQPDPEAE